jgi:hypothetical protein
MEYVMGAMIIETRNNVNRRRKMGDRQTEVTLLGFFSVIVGSAVGVVYVCGGLTVGSGVGVEDGGGREREGLGTVGSAGG